MALCFGKLSCSEILIPQAEKILSFRTKNIKHRTKSNRSAAAIPVYCGIGLNCTVLFLSDWKYLPALFVYVTGRLIDRRVQSLWI